jgi:membrane protease YdiL (CAAX protease family)
MKISRLHDQNSRCVLQVGVLLVFSWLVAIGLLWGVASYSPSDTQTMLLQVVANAATLVGAVILGRRFKLAPVQFGKGKRWLGVFVLFAVVTLAALSEERGLTSVLLVSGVFFWTATAEEVLFRHYMYELIGSLTQRFTTQVITNSLLFSLLHLPVAVMTGYWWVLATSFAFGVFATVLRRLTSGIGWPFLAHLFVDIVSEL